MKGRIFIAATLIFVFITAFAIPAGISGKWTGIITMPGGRTVTFHYIFKVEGNNLSGSATGSNTFDLSSGRIYGDSLSFSIVVNNGDSIVNTGKYYPEGDSIKLTAEFMGAPMYGTLKRDSPGAVK